MAMVSQETFQAYSQNMEARLHQLEASIDSRLGELRGQSGQAQTSILQNFQEWSDKNDKQFANLATSAATAIADIQRDFKVHDEGLQTLFKNAKEKFEFHDRDLQAMLANSQAKFSQTEVMQKKAEEKYTELRGEIDVALTVINDQVKTSNTNNEENKKKLDEVINAYRDLYAKTETAFEQIHKGREGEGHADKDRNFQKRNYLPMKNIMPKRLGDKVSEWRMWRDDTTDFLDVANPGLGGLLKHLMTYDGDDNDAAVDNVVNQYNWKNGTNFDEDARVATWRALKRLTEGATLSIVLSIKAEHGFRAWIRIARNFLISLDGQKGAALSELANMVSNKATTPEQTRQKLTEYETKVLFCEEISGEPLGDTHKKSIILGFMDPMTRQATVNYHGQEERVLYKQILLFVNGVHQPDKVSTGGATPMVIGAMTEPKPDEPAPAPTEDPWSAWSAWSAWTPEWGDWGDSGEQPTGDDSLNAFKGKGGGKNGKGKGKGLCFGCGSPDHRIADCPKKSEYYKGKSSGKGHSGSPSWSTKGKSGGKGSWSKGGKGPRGGCNQCGGPHYQSECPMNRPGQPTGAWPSQPTGGWPSQPNGGFRSLASIVEVKNSFEELQEKEETPGSLESGKLESGKIPEAGVGKKVKSKSRDDQMRDEMESGVKKLQEVRNEMKIGEIGGVKKLSGAGTRDGKLDGMETSDESEGNQKRSGKNNLKKWSRMRSDEIGEFKSVDQCGIGCRCIDTNCGETVSASLKARSRAQAREEAARRWNSNQVEFPAISMPQKLLDKWIEIPEIKS